MRANQASGGTNQRGVDPASFHIGPGMRMRYDVPHPSLAEYLTGYAIYIDDGRAPMVNWYLPAPPIMSILLDAGPLSVTIRRQTFDDIPQATLWGPTSDAYRTVTHGGISVGIGMTALGWACLTGKSADLYRNRVTPLAAMIGTSTLATLIDALQALDDDAAIAPLLDERLPALFRADTHDQEHIAGLSQLVQTNGVIGVDDVAERLGIDTRTLRRIATRHFGLPSKALLVRARFVRSFARWMAAGEPASYAGIDSSYFDASHFLLDAQKFLGTTPRRFVKGDITYLRASLRARAAVLGAAAHVLHAA